MSDEIAEELLKRGKKLFEPQSAWLPFWQETASQYYPQRADFEGELTWGEEFSAHLFDEGPVIMRRDLANNIASILRPRQRQWFEPALHDERYMKVPGIADWFEQVGKTMWRVMYDPKSGFVRAMKEADHDFVTFGNAVLAVEQRRTLDGLRFTCYHPRDCAWAENADGEIDTLHRKITMTARQIKQRFRKAVLHKDILDACEKEPEKTFECRHVMMPIEDFTYVSDTWKKYRKYPFVSAYLDVGHKELLSVEGSYEFRYVVPRWQPINGSPYAVSPATSDTISGARQLQVMARVGNEALEKSVDPPSAATMDAVLGPVDLRAGGVTYKDRDYNEKTGAALEIFDQVGKNAVLALQAIDAQRLRLADGMLVSKLNLPPAPLKDLTAFEVQKRIEEYVRNAMPLVEPWEANYSAPVLDATYSILLRVGAFPPPPQALKGQDFQWTFRNPLQETIQRAKSEAFVSVMGIVTAAGQIDQGVYEDIDIREGTRDAVRGMDAEESWIRDKDEADERVALKQKVAELTQLVVAAQSVGEAAGSVGDGIQKMNGAINGQPAAA